MRQHLTTSKIHSKHCGWADDRQFVEVDGTGHVGLLIIVCGGRDPLALEGGVGTCDVDVLAAALALSSGDRHGCSRHQLTSSMAALFRQCSAAMPASYACRFVRPIRPGAP